MSLTYWVVFRDAAGRIDGAEVPTSKPLEGPAGRAEAQQVLAEQGVDRPQITGWALRSTSEQEK